MFEKIQHFEATINDLETEIKNDQNKWLRLQCNIVSMSEKLTQLLNDEHLARQREFHNFGLEFTFIYFQCQNNLIFCGLSLS